MKQLLYILSIVLFVACSKVSERQPVVIQAQALKPVKADPMVLQGQKSHIDSLFKYATEKEITIYAKLLGQDRLMEIAAKKFPENIENTITIFRDNLGHIIRISESPSSETGDWFISCNHYFDEKGITFAFEKTTNSFNSHCTEGVLYETKTEYYDDKFTRVDYTYKLVDESDRPIVSDSCDIFNYEYKASPNLSTYLAAKAIPQDKKAAISQ
jgi:hypothetical protein